MLSLCITAAMLSIYTIDGLCSTEQENLFIMTTNETGVFWCLLLLLHAAVIICLLYRSYCTGLVQLIPELVATIKR